MQLHRKMICYGYIQQNDLNCISATLLYTFFQSTISRRMDPEKLRMDEEMVSLFKKNNKTIVELNNNAALSLGCINNEVNLKAMLQDPDNHAMVRKARNILATYADTVNNYYKKPQDRLIHKPYVKKITAEFLFEDPEQYLNRTSYPIDNEVINENAQWAETFNTLHNEGHSGLLLANGLNHILPMDDTSILTLLHHKGFSLQRIQEPKPLPNLFVETTSSCRFT